MNKIVLVNSSLSNGGSEKVMSILANEFIKRGYDVTMLLFLDKESYFLDVKVNKIILKKKYKGVIGKIYRLVQIRKHIKKSGSKNVISFMYNINIQVLLACIGLKKNIIVSERNDPSRRNTLVNKITNVLYLLFATKIVVQTDYVKKFFLGKNNKKTIVISNPVDIRDSNIVYERDKRIVSVGRLTHQKNFKFLIDAFSEFIKNKPNYTLHIFGEGELENDLRALCKQKKIENQVFFEGYVSNLIDCIKGASMFISTSLYEGISNAMLESLILGIPTICTNCPVGGAASMIKNGYNGYLVEINNKEQLLKSMNDLINNEDKTNDMVKNAVKSMQKYNVKNIVDEWEKLL